jgi:hypothetical protein
MKNLLLVGSITNKVCTIVFDVDDCWIKSLKNPTKIIARGRINLTNNLYKLDVGVLKSHIHLVDETTQVDVLH